jgi:hypothetical protein
MIEEQRELIKQRIDETVEDVDITLDDVRHEISILRRYVNDPCEERVMKESEESIVKWVFATIDFLNKVKEDIKELDI